MVFKKKGQCFRASVSSDSDSSTNQYTSTTLYSNHLEKFCTSSLLSCSYIWKTAYIFSTSKSPSPAFSPRTPSSSSCFTTPPRPNIGLSPLTPSSQLTSTPSPRSLSESVGQHTDAISLSTDQGDTTDGIDFLEHSTNEPGYNPVVISSDDEHLTEIQSSPCLDILSSPVSLHFQWGLLRLLVWGGLRLNCYKFIWNNERNNCVTLADSSCVMLYMYLLSVDRLLQCT